MKPQPRKSVERLEGYSEEARTDVDLSANTNLFDPNPAIARVLESFSPSELQGYPTLTSQRLREAVARKVSVTPEQVITGNGSNDIIDCAIRAFAEPGERVVWHPPSFEMIPIFASANAAEPVGVELRDDLSLDASGIRAARGKITFLCRPNNPTGNAFPREEVVELLQELGGLVVVDEAYVEFLGDSMLAEAVPRDNVLVLRTFSKAHGLAGLRIGYGVGSPRLIREIEKVRGPFKLNAFSERVAVEALQDDAYVQAIVRRVRAERAWLGGKLGTLGFEVFPSDANFLLMRPPADARLLARDLAAQGITVRTFAGRLHDCVRATVPPRSVGERFLSAIEKVLGG